MTQKLGFQKMHEWENVFLVDARDRLNGMISGYKFTINDMAAMVCRLSGTKILKD